MPHNAASDLGLHCLPLSHKKDARLIWVEGSRVIVYRWADMATHGTLTHLSQIDLHIPT